MTKMFFVCCLIRGFDLSIPPGEVSCPGELLDSVQAGTSNSLDTVQNPCCKVAENTQKDMCIM